MRFRGGLLALLIAAVPDPCFATPPAGVVSNVMLAQGVSAGPIKEQITVENWAVRLEGEGESEFYVQELVVAPNGYTGWHSHPGLLLITVKDGLVDFYDKNCAKRVYTAGQSFIEAAEPHNAVNPGSNNARLFVAYIVKKGQPRRLEAPQPKCGEALGLP
jgi:quercetin dioxygenase-like cupin family protein